MIVGNPPGTGNDVWGRLIARHMPGQIPGKPHIVVQNMPGAGTINAANYLYNRAPKDGTVFGTISRNLVTADLLGRKNMRFDLKKFVWIGSPEIENRVCAASTSSGVKSVQDLFRQELVVGGTGAGTMPTLPPQFINRFAGTKFNVVSGYPGSAEVMIALDRHEVDGVCVTLGLFKGPYAYLIENKKVRILFNSEPDRIDGSPDVPSIFEFIKGEDDKQG